MADSDWEETGLVPPERPALPDPRPETAVDKLRLRYEKLQERDLGIVAAVNRFAEIPTMVEDPSQSQIQLLLMGPEEDVKKAGWKSKKELRLAFYGTLSKKNWPAAAQAAHERVGMRLRKQTKIASKMQFNLNMVTIPAPRRDTEARVVIVEDKRNKEE